MCKDFATSYGFSEKIEKQIEETFTILLEKF